MAGRVWRMSAEDQIRRLLDIMAALRDPQTGCPWDKAQSFETIAPYAIEEAHEVADAIARHDLAALPDELGDLLLQVVYQSRLAEEAGLFTFADVARGIADKMRRRHPHIFEASGATPADPAGSWEAAKHAERAARDEHGALGGVALSLPALSRAAKLSARAARVGFDWPQAAAALDKLEEEARELRDELPHADPSRLDEELGDLLFSAANVARKLGIDPEACLRRSNRKFERRFAAVEESLSGQGRSLIECSLAELEQAWTRAKALETQDASTPAG